MAEIRERGPINGQNGCEAGLNLKRAYKMERIADSGSLDRAANIP